MTRATILVGLVGLLGCFGAFAEIGVPTRLPSDPQFSCTFGGTKEGEPTCQAFGTFGAKKPSDNSLHLGRQGDGLKVVCKNSSMGNENQIYNGPIGTQLIPDSDDHGSIVDTRFSGRTVDTPRFIDVQDLNWNTLTGMYKASLTYGTLPLPLAVLQGNCEFHKP